MIKEIKLPDLGEGIEGADISEVTVSVGDSVSIDDTVLVLESDKTSMEIPSEFAGTILEVLVDVGDVVSTGQLLLKIETSESSVKGAEKKSTENPKDESLIERKPTDTQKKDSQLKKEPILKEHRVDGSVFASPGVRRLARELAIDLKVIKGSGKKSRITKGDLHGYIKMRMEMSSVQIQQPKQIVDFSQWGEVEIQKLTKVNKITGSRLQDAWQEIPHVTQYDNGDITKLDQLRKSLKVDAKENGVKITFLPFLMKAVVVVLKEMPKFNSSLDETGENLVLKNYYHIGVAVDTPSGLMVPSITNVDSKTIFELSKELMDISTRARNKKLNPAELRGSTFTISSLGGVGGTNFSPIVNPPEVAILGVSKSEWRPVYEKQNKELRPRYILPFSLSYDHRVIDGASGAAFTYRLSQVLADPEFFKD